MEGGVLRINRRRYHIRLVGLLLLAGCGTNTATVTGKVEYKGEPVATGTISFFSQGLVVETEITDGAYAIHGVPIGEAKITIIRLDPTIPDPRDALTKARRQSAEKNGKRFDPAVIADPSRLEKLQRKRHLLPYSYASLTTSDLRYTVMLGSNTFDIKLIDPPKAN